MSDFSEVSFEIINPGNLPRPLIISVPEGIMGRARAEIFNTKDAPKMGVVWTENQGEPVEQLFRSATIYVKDNVPERAVVDKVNALDTFMASIDDTRGELGGISRVFVSFPGNGKGQLCQAVNGRLRTVADLGKVEIK